MQAKTDVVGMLLRLLVGVGVHCTNLILCVTNSYLSDGIVLTELGLVPNLLMRNKVEQAGCRERFLFRKQQ